VNWGVENNIYQLGHRGCVAVKGGAGGVSRLANRSSNTLCTNLGVFWRLIGD